MRSKPTITAIGLGVAILSLGILAVLMVALGPP
jgi:hypothetical protein